MAVTRRYMEIPVDSINSTRIQSRQRHTDTNVHNLAVSIRTHGLFYPVLVVESGRGGGGYDLISGQRRLRAYRDVLAGGDSDRFAKIPAFIYGNLQEWEKKAMSINENFNQEPVTETDKTAAVTACYNEFGDMGTTAEKTGISYDHVRKYVGFERLPAVLKDMKTAGEISLKTALQTADLFGIETSGVGDVPEREMALCAKELELMRPSQKTRVLKASREEPGTPIPRVITEVKTRKPRMMEIKTEVAAATYSRMEVYRDREGIRSIPLAASELVDDGLDRNGI